jgi:hypothetical protein
MKKNDLNAALRRHAMEKLSPTPEERKFVTDVYAAIQAVLGEANCIQIGSYPRFTAVTPLHDLDVLFRLGRWTGGPANPGPALASVESDLRAKFRNPTKHTLRVVRQTHSISIVFLDRDKEVFAVDVVPAYPVGTNEFDDATYMVPEIAAMPHGRRAIRYNELLKSAGSMTWIKSDPVGYIAVAKRLNDQNEDFRKSVKFVKGWKHALKSNHPELNLKSFHVEQLLTASFVARPQITAFDAVFEFFCELPQNLSNPKIRDRADSTKFIDDYVRDLTVADRSVIREARDRFLIDLENIDEHGDVGRLLTGERHRRVHPTEEYLFDKKIPVLIDPSEQLMIQGEVLPRDGGFRGYILDKIGLIKIDRKIRFSIAKFTVGAEIYKWKVKNDDGCSEPRGEITDHQTRNHPESTRYSGKHYVECYALKNGVCVARALQNVHLERFF